MTPGSSFIAGLVWFSSCLTSLTSLTCLTSLGRWSSLKDCMVTAWLLKACWRLRGLESRMWITSGSQESRVDPLDSVRGGSTPRLAVSSSTRRGAAAWRCEVCRRGLVCSVGSCFSRLSGAIHNKPETGLSSSKIVKTFKKTFAA